MGIGLLVAGFVIWLGAIGLDFYKKKKGSIPAASIVSVVALGFLIIAVSFIWIGIESKHLKDFFIQNTGFFANLGNTFLSVAITVFILDNLNERRRKEERKQEIFAQMKSGVRDVAVEAAGLIRRNEWLNEALQKVHLTSVQLAGVNFSGAHLEGVNLMWAHLEGANLRGANLKGAWLQQAHLEGANLQQAQLQGAQLQDAYLSKAILVWAHLEGAYLNGAHLEGANLEMTYLNGAFLEDANLVGANLKDAFLMQVNLEGANLEGANLVGALYTQATVWPEDFNPEASGAFLVD